MIKWILSFCILFIFMSGCSPQGTGKNDGLNYKAFLKLLDESGFSYEEFGGRELDFLTIEGKIVFVGDDMLTIYEYHSNEVMERDAGGVHLGGMSVDISIDEEFSKIVFFEPISIPYWFKKDLVIVFYVGENQLLIDFLSEHLDLFAGYGCY